MELIAVLSMVVICSLFLRKLYEGRRNQNCLILDYVCFKPSDDRKLNSDICGDLVMRNKNLGLNEYKFLLKIISRSGLGEETYAPRNLICEAEREAEEVPSLIDGISEMDEIFYASLDELFTKSAISPLEIDILVVNVSMLSPAPSLCARIVNHYKMREGIKVFNLSGMGCSASIVSIDIVRNIFKRQSMAFAVVVTTECMGPNWYHGTDQSMLVANCLFRAGGCSILLTNNPDLRYRAKFRLKCLVRTHLGTSDGYSCCIQKEDDMGRLGFHVGKGLPKAAAQALFGNLKGLAPKVLPLRELLRYVVFSLVHKLNIKGSETAHINFKAGVEHFCLHSGGMAVIDGVERTLKLSRHDLEPARMTLHRFGNTSASSLWYVLGYMEAKRTLKKRHRILMISLGAGFMCNSCLWEVVRDLEDANAWEDCIDGYPVETHVNPYMEKYRWINDQ